MGVEAKLKELNLQLPNPPKPAGVYKPCVVMGSLVYTSGHGPLMPDGKLTTGKIGLDIDPQSGYEAARQTGLAILATLKQSLGSLDRIKRLVKTLGMVNCVTDFYAHPSIINGFSDLMRDLLGEENGVGARSAVGMGSLPGNMTVEIEAIFEIG